MFYIKRADQLQFTTTELKVHLENLFDEYMTWDNRGAQGKGQKFSRSSYGWTLGHLMPRNKFPDTKEGELEYWSLKNLIPEWAWFNHLKGIMTPQEMKTWLEEEDILNKISEILSNQILMCSDNR